VTGCRVLRAVRWAQAHADDPARTHSTPTAH
jgi:hypothetical protein